MNLLETGLSFAEGLALIASPCILPVLPLVLSASVEGGRRRPFGIILGFVIAFTAFALLSRKLVMLLGLDLDIIKYGSLVFLAMFGVILLSGRLSEKFSALTGRFASAGSDLSSKAQDGFMSGVLIGMLIGLVWTPCAGPILAAVLVQVIRQESDLQALFLVSAFAFGAGVPMLIISLVGRKAMSKLGFIANHAETVRKGFGVLILLAVAFIASGIDPQTLFSSEEKTQKIAAEGLQDALANPYPAPEFAGIEAWLNSEPLTMAGLKGKVVLIDFWTYSCINCVRTLPYITRWDQDYRDKDLVIIGIHAPEFEFEKSQENVEAAIRKHNIRYPVALDNNLDTWTNFKNRYWPAHYLIDRDGRIVYTHFGEGNYAETENNIRYLLGLDRKTEEKDIAVTSKGQTPETYLGYKRAANFSSPEAIDRDVLKNYTFPEALKDNQWALEGGWTVSNEHITAAEAGSSMKLNFKAGKVFLVMGVPEGKTVRALLTLNGEPLKNLAGKDAPDGTVTVDRHALYELVSQPSPANGLLTIRADEPGLEAYAFTFGN